MNIEQYRTMLRAVEQALKVCDQSVGFMDEIQREVCQNLHAIHARLLGLIDSTRQGHA
jgi:hypothetical protein